MRASRASLTSACCAAAVLLLAGCSSATSSDNDVSTAAAPSPETQMSQAETSEAKAGDAPGLVAAMWGQLNEASKKQLCDIYATRGDEAGQIFVAGTQTDVKASVLTDDDKAAIAKSAGELLAKECRG